MIKRFFVLVSKCLFILTLIVISTSNKGETMKTLSPVIFKPGADVLLVSQLIGMNGGTVKIDHAETPLYGVVIRFPQGALLKDTEISIGYNSGSLTPNEGTYSGSTLVIKAKGVVDFECPVEIAVPFHDPDKMPVPYYIDDDGKLYLGTVRK